MGAAAEGISAFGSMALGMVATGESAGGEKSEINMMALRVHGTTTPTNSKGERLRDATASPSTKCTDNATADDLFQAVEEIFNDGREKEEIATVDPVLDSDLEKTCTVNATADVLFQAVDEIFNDGAEFEDDAVFADNADVLDYDLEKIFCSGS